MNKIIKGLMILYIFGASVMAYKYHIPQIFIVNIVLLLLILIDEFMILRKNRREMKLRKLVKIEDEILFSPIPFTVLDNKGKIIWHNESFDNITGIDNPEGSFIFDALPQFNVEKLYSDDKYIYKLRNNHYKVIREISSSEEAGKIIRVYLIDVSERENILYRYSERELVIGIVYIDNFEDIFGMESNIDQNKGLAKIDNHIYVLSNRINGFAEKIDEYRYLLFFEKRYLEFLENRKFEILDDVKKIDFGGKLPVTISIGIGSGGKNIKENYYFAKTAMDLALGRGGDQAVIKSGEKLTFYGGKTKAVEKRTKVKARVMAHALRGIIDQSDTVFIMGHKSPDLDCFGAAIGMYRVAKSRGKKAYIVMNGVSASINLIYQKLKENHSEYIDNIVDSKEAKKLITESSVAIVVDTHKYNHVESEEFLRKVDNKVVIDHHRMGKDVIEDTILSYIETYASSTCELVTEILMYIAEDANLQKIEAEALLSGISLDTKQFSVKTGVRTFEAAAYLRRKGADTEMVRELFRNNIRDLKIKAMAIEEAEIVNGNIAIAKIKDVTESANLIAAQTADELLNTTSTEATFVFSQLESGIHISARSVGEVNVQIIMEKVGGGGHLNSAGARLDTDMDDAVAQVKNLIKEQL